MTDLDRKIADLRARRVGLRKALERAGLIVDVVDMRRTIEHLNMELRATEPEWRRLNQELDARNELRELRHKVAQLRAAQTRATVAPMRRGAVSIAGYRTKMMTSR
jgi:hypothetical protein